MFEFTYPTPLQAKPDLQGPQTGSIWAFKKFWWKRFMGPQDSCSLSIGLQMEWSLLIDNSWMQHMFSPE